MVRWLPFLICFAGQLAWSAEEAPSATNPENGIKPGHSLHGEAFDEGPRRAAYLMGTTGHVSFSISSKHPQAQAFFNQGIGQLHGFWYFEAERSFRQVSLLDHDCAMAYWGMALANVNNDKRAKLFIADAVKRKGTATEREKMYIDALDAWYKAETGDEKKKKTRAQNYVTALENIIHKFPDDVEARAMLGLFLWQNRAELDEPNPGNQPAASGASLSSPSVGQRQGLAGHELGRKLWSVCSGYCPHVAYVGAHLFGSKAVFRRRLAPGSRGENRSCVHDPRRDFPRRHPQLCP
jgi:hypothetical protein